MREHELFTYTQNKNLKKENDEVQAQNKSISEQLAQMEEEECRLTQTIEDVCVELPRCNIQPESSLLQKVKIIEDREKYLEQTVERMDAEHKAHITEVEARGSATPPKQHEERTKDLKAFVVTIALCHKDTQKLLDDTTTTWATMEEFEDLVVV